MSDQNTVLVVEDEEHIRTVIEYNLRLDGFEVFQAGDAVKALEFARQIKPDLILLDWMMPDRSGLEVLADLKHADETRHIPVIMLTARGTESDMQRAREVGADAHITKPFAPRLLGETIRNTIEQTALAVGQQNAVD
jgi:two-component system phosphate regulon response regulator PhoB